MSTIRSRFDGARPGALMIACLLLVVGLSAPAPASAALVYTLSGGGLSGSLGGTAFSDATWSFSGIGDAENVQSGLIGGLLPATYNFFTEQPTMTIRDGSNQWVAELFDVGGLSWAAFSTEGSVPQPYSANGVGLLDSNLDGSLISSINSPPVLSSDLITPVLINGLTEYDGATLPTSAGMLVITEGTVEEDTSFQVAAAPLPGTLALLGAGLLAGLGRRLRIREWAYDNGGAPIAVGDTGNGTPMPTPATPLLTLLGLGAMGVTAYRRRREEGLKRLANEAEDGKS